MSETQDLPHWFTERAEARLKFLYGETAMPALMNRLIQLIYEFTAGRFQPKPSELWNERDVIFITYGDSIQRPEERPLFALFKFLTTYLKDTFSSVHILPYFPYSSDDGFAVIDYRAVNSDLGNWEDIQRIAHRFKLMTDLVINHVSRENLWFVDYLSNAEPGRDYFIELDPDTDLSSVVRPRNTPLLVKAYTRKGLRHVWATFSKDQIDLNFKNPDVLLEFIELLLFYLHKGSKIIRLDAVAFLWKRLGTRCIHLRETHEVVKLLRDIIEVAAPSAVLITETNVPNGENLSYFGNSDEAHMIYQFTFPPLVLHALYRGNSQYLTYWAKDTSRPPKGCTFLNFIASHDGIGLRPAEGILPEDQLAQLVDAMHQFGGYVTLRANSDGVDTPYEINISLFDALKGTVAGPDQWQIQRFICAHAIMLALQGIPAFYIHSLLATPNDLFGVEQTGRTRAINRHKWNYDKLIELLNNPRTPNAEVFHELIRLIQIRRQQKAFHPDGAQKTLDLGHSVFALWRTSPEKDQQILTISNITPSAQTIELPAPCSNGWRDLISGAESKAGQLTLPAYESVWLECL